MSDEKTSPPTATGNQNLIVGLVLGAVVLLLFLLVIQMTGGQFGRGSSKSDEVGKLKAERDALLAKSGQGAAGGQGAQTIAERIKGDSTTLADLATQLQTALAQTTTDLNSTRSLYQRALTELDQANQRLAAAGANASQVALLQRDVADKEILLQQADARITDLLQQLSGAPKPSDLTTMRGQLDNAIRLRDDYQQQLTALQAKTRGMVAGEQAGALSEENLTLKKQVGDLEAEKHKLLYQLQELRAELDKTRLFVEKVDDLPAAAQALYVELSKLESASPAEMKQEYQRIEQELKASVKDTIKFQTGSSRIDLDKVEEIRRAMQSGGDDSFFLVVGYASKSGGLDKNRQLSADRATTIASVANFKKKSGQGVQAVFLSATARFSATDLPQNQVCEVWEIQK